MSDPTKIEGEQAPCAPDEIRTASYRAAAGHAAVEITIPGAVVLRMSSGQALALAARIGLAAVAGQKFGVEGEVVAGPHDMQIMAAILGGALEGLIELLHGPGGPGSTPPEST